MESAKELGSENQGLKIRVQKTGNLCDDKLSMILEVCNLGVKISALLQKSLEKMTTYSPPQVTKRPKNYFKTPI